MESSFSSGKSRNSLIFEYDKEEEERKLRKAGFEAGVAEGEIKAKKEVASVSFLLGL